MNLGLNKKSNKSEIFQKINKSGGCLLGQILMKLTNTYQKKKINSVRYLKWRPISEIPFQQQ